MFFKIIGLALVMLLNHLHMHVEDIIQYTLDYLPQTESMVMQIEDKVYMGFHYSTEEDFWVEFAPTGGNQLMGISKFITTQHREVWDKQRFAQAQKEILLDACTDWIGPYMARKGLIAIDEKAEFTGGWHTAPNDEDIITARTVKYHLWGNKLTVTNRIMGYNTIDQEEEILEEEVTYIMRDGILDVSVRAKALTDCTIERYYGLQSQDSLHQGRVTYEGSEEISYRVDESSYSKPYNGIDDKVITLYSEDEKHRLDVKLDEGFGLGKGDYVAEGQSYAFTMNYRKSYFNLVHGIELPMKQDAVITWRGYYKFSYRQ